MRNALLLSGFILSCASPAFAQTIPATAPLGVNIPPPSIPAPRRDRDFDRLVSELTEVRQDALELRESDGGTLSDEHRDAVQARIDDAFARYRRNRSSRR